MHLVELKIGYAGFSVTINSVNAIKKQSIARDDVLRLDGSGQKPNIDVT